jgi:mono/diheme cytochrome c family protein
MLRTVFATLAATAAIGAAVAAWVVFGGGYDVSATGAHLQPVHSALELAMNSSVRERARDLAPPSSPDAATLRRGAACYRAHCLQCHGAPGVAPGPIGQGMQPLPGPLIDAARRWQPGEIYWITRHGIKMSGMPAWQMRLSDDDLWAVTAFVMQLAHLSAPAYRDHEQAATAERCDAHGSADAAGVLALRQYACVGCHTIPGVTGPRAHVGPPLAGFARRTTIAGRLANNEDNLVRWIRGPQAVKPGTAMPDMGVSEAHARQMAAYLATLH